MAHDPIAPQASSAIAAVESSRAWILGLVVEPDGSVSGPGSVAVSEWPLRDCALDCAIDHEHDTTTI